LAEAVGASVSVAWLSFGKPGKSLEAGMDALGSELSITYIKAYEELFSLTQLAGQRGVTAGDKHPDAYSHGLIAERILRDLQADNLLPGV